MKTLQQIREEIAALHDESEAILALTKSESREPDADESKRLDDILASNETLKAQESRAVKLESLKAEAIARRNPQAAPIAQGDGSTRARIEVPRSVRPPATLALGRGVMDRREQEEEAYGFGSFMLAAVFQHEPSRQWCKDHGIPIRNAMTEGFDSKGGVLVPEQYEASLIRLVNEYGVARRECMVEPMSGDTATTPRRTGGLTTYYPGEGGTITASDMTLDAVKLTARKLAALGRYSNELNTNAILSIADMLAMEAALAMANAEDSALFNGDGTSTYGRIVGLKNALTTGSKYTAATGNTAYSTLDVEDFVGMLGQVQTYAYKFGNAKWYIHRAGWAASMQRLALAAGGNTVANLVNGVPQNSFAGYPVVFVEVMNNTLTAQTSTNGLCYFGDLKQSVKFGDRAGISVALSPDVYFTTDEQAIRWTSRYDINVHDVGVTGGASGGVVVLATPGS